MKTFAVMLFSTSAIWAQSYEVIAAKDIMLPMRDGIRLCTDIYRPARNGAPVPEKFPIILERTPYGKGFVASSADYFVRRGYVVIFQDVRGRYKSEGKWAPIRDDPNDGFDTAKWLGEQPWSKREYRDHGIILRRRDTTCDGHRQRSLRKGHGSTQCHVEFRTVRRSP